MSITSLLTGALGGAGSDDVRGAAALRLRVRLQPAGGAGARLMPSTYSSRTERDGRAVYLKEPRRIEDSEVQCVLIDGQASQSNRLEEALLLLTGSGAFRIPDIVVDQREFGRHSTLEMSHRLFDAWAEDALLGDARFGATDTFDRLARVINRGVAKPMVELFPVGLLLGCWASRRHNPQGSTRLARSITSEIIGYDMLEGQRAASRIDMHHVSSEVPMVEAQDEAVPGQPRFEIQGDAKAKKAKRPSEFGYGNVTPQAADHGGVTVRFAEQHTVVSLAALRATRTAEFGVPEPSNPDTDLAARELLALLALAMLEAQVETGWDLRSGCQLVPESEPTVELVGRVGTVVAASPLVGLGATEALREAISQAPERGVRWDVDPIELVASPQQLELLRRSVGRPADEATEA